MLMEQVPKCLVNFCRLAPIFQYYSEMRKESSIKRGLTSPQNSG